MKFSNLKIKNLIKCKFHLKMHCFSFSLRISGLTYLCSSYHEDEIHKFFNDLHFWDFEFNRHFLFDEKSTMLFFEFFSQNHHIVSEDLFFESIHFIILLITKSPISMETLINLFLQQNCFRSINLYIFNKNNSDIFLMFIDKFTLLNLSLNQKKSNKVLLIACLIYFEYQILQMNF